MKRQKKNYKAMLIILLSIILSGCAQRIDWAGDEIRCFESELMWKKYNESLIENDVLTYSVLINDPDTIVVDNHTKVKVLVEGDSILDAAKIQVLEGYYKDRTCWLDQMAIE